MNIWKSIPRAYALSLLCVLPTVYGADDTAQVIVSATALRESALETAQPVAVLGGDDLVRLREPSLGETLAAQPGISATYFGPQASRPVIRGLGGERVQMYEDGGDALDVSALSNDHSVTIDPLLAERVEVVRGPATLLYGNGASGGLINVLTNRVPEIASDDQFSGALELRGDSALSERAVSARADGGSGAFAWHADAHRSETSDVRIPGFALSRGLRAQLEAAGDPVNDIRDRLPNTGSETWGGALGGSWIGDRGLLGVGASRYDTDYGITNTGGEEGVHIDMQQRRYDLKGELRDLGPFIRSTRLRATYNDYEHAEVEGSGEVGTLFEQRGSDTRLVFDHVPVAGWRGTFGLQYRDIELAVTGEEALVPPSSTTNAGWFVFEERPFGDVTLELGARLEHQHVNADREDAPSYRDNAMSGSAGVVWKFAPIYALAVNVTSTQRHPTATELFANGPHIAAQRFEIGDASLHRERATTLDVGLRKTAGAWSGALTAFRSDYSRYIFAAFTGELAGDEEELLPVVQYSQADATFTGFELEVKLPITETPLGALAPRVMADYVRAKLSDGGDLPQIPPLRLGGELVLARDRFTSGLSVMYYASQDKVSENELPTDGYTMVDLDFAYRLPGRTHTMMFFVRGQNLLDEEARRHTSPLKDVAPLPGRSVAAGVRVEL
jgi:iron complex outermembrane receptor protein